MARARGRTEEAGGACAGREDPRPSPVAYMGGGGGEWDPDAPVWHAVAGHTGRPTVKSAQQIRAWSTRRATWGPGPAITSRRAWVVALIATLKNRKRRRSWVGQSCGRG